MRYPELAAVDSTPDQDLGLTIAYKAMLLTLTPEDLPDAPRTAGAYLAARVTDVLSSYAVQHIEGVQTDRIADAFIRATPQAKAAAATALGVDLDVEIPDAPTVPTEAEDAPLTAARAVEAPAPETWGQWAARMTGWSNE